MTQNTPERTLDKYFYNQDKKLGWGCLKLSISPVIIWYLLNNFLGLDISIIQAYALYTTIKLLDF